MCIVSCGLVCSVYISRAMCHTLNLMSGCLVVKTAVVWLKGQDQWLWMDNSWVSDEDCMFLWCLWTLVEAECQVVIYRSSQWLLMVAHVWSWFGDVFCMWWNLECREFMIMMKMLIWWWWWWWWWWYWFKLSADNDN